MYNCEFCNVRNFCRGGHCDFSLWVSKCPATPFSIASVSVVKRYGLGLGEKLRPQAERDSFVRHI